MEAMLTEAAMTGSVATLLDLLQQDPLLLDKIIVLCVSETPLHVAALMGHAEFAAELLTRRPELAAELDSDGNSPLHLAAAKGRPDMAELLLRACPEAAKVRNLDGRTPLHVAAAKGRVEVVSQLVRNGGELTRSLTDRGETAMHLCVRNGKVEALRVIIKEIGKDNELVNWRDSDGNSILHIAVAKKNIEIIKLLLTVPGLSVNLLNKNGSTALDILTQSPRDLKDLEIEESLVSAGALHSKETDSITTSSEWRHYNSSVKFETNPKPPPLPPLELSKVSSKRQSLQRPFTVLKGISKKLTPPPPPKQGNWLGRKRSSLMVVASLIATVAFQAAITPPGGVWQDDFTIDEDGNPVSNPHKAGTAIMAYNGKDTYGFYMISNTVSFLASLSIILLLVSGLPIQRRRWVWIQMVIMWIAITALVVTYFISLRNMSILDKKQVDGQFRDMTEISVLTWLCLMLVVFFGNVARMNMWVLRKYGLIKEKEKHQHSLVDDDEDEEDNEDEL